MSDIAARHPRKKKQPPCDASRFCGIAGCLSENAFDALLCLFPAAKALKLGMIGS
jgi:hypothetical protein